MRIQGKMTLIVLSTSLVTLLVISGIMFYGMLGARNMAIQYSSEIGKQSNENSSRLLAEQQKNELIDIAADKADDIDYRLRVLEKSVRIAAKTMQKIHAHPHEYKPQKVDAPPSDGAGKYVFYMQYAPNTNTEALAYEMGISANIKDTLLGLAECNPIIDSIFVTLHHNYTLSVDNNTATSAAQYEAPDLHYDALASDWFRLAEKKHDVTFTPVREFVFSKELGFFCAVPFYKDNGELQGVSCLQSTLKGLERIVEDVPLRITGFCFVVDDRGHVILSSDDRTDRQQGILPIDLHTDLRTSENTALAETVTQMVSGEKDITEVTLHGSKYFMAFAPIRKTGWSFATAIAEEEVMAPIAKNNESIQKLTKQNIDLFNHHMTSTIKATAILVLGLLGAVLVAGKKASERFVNPLHTLTDGVRDIASGNLNKKIHIDTKDEIAHLAACFNSMTSNLKESMENLARATEQKEQQNTMLVKKNAELSAALHDIRQLRIARDNYRAESEIDHLTHLYNKATTERICTVRCQNLTEDRRAALFIIDLDHFKKANDTLGHQYGDRILAEFALRLKLICRTDDCVGRFGGDEFVVLMIGALSEDVIQKRAQAILQAARDLYIDGTPSAITASIGIAIAPVHGTDYPSLFQSADRALYYVKEHGRDGCHIGIA